MSKHFFPPTNFQLLHPKQAKTTTTFQTLGIPQNPQQQQKNSGEIGSLWEMERAHTKAQPPGTMKKQHTKTSWPNNESPATTKISKKNPLTPPKKSGNEGMNPSPIYQAVKVEGPSFPTFWASQKTSNLEIQ